MKTLFGALMSMVVLAACTSPSVSQPEQALAGKDADLEMREMPKAYGKMGCNGMMFQANVIGAGKIDFGHIAVSMMLCEDMKLEDAFLRKQSVWNYRFDGNDLILEQKGISIRLRRE